MKKLSKNKEINKLAHSILKINNWKIRRGKHNVLIAPSGKILPIPGSPSDYRAFENFRHDLQRLHGLG